MKNGVKRLICLILAAFILMTGFWINPISGKAATGVIKKLSMEKTYKSWDIDQDGAKDKIIIKATKDEYDFIENAKIYVNGKCKYTCKGENGAVDMAIYIMPLETGEHLILIRSEGYDNWGPAKILAWSNEKNKLINIFNITSAAGIADYGYLLIVKPIGVSENKVDFEFTHYNNVCGEIHFSYEYEYSNGKMKRVSNAGKLLHLYRLNLTTGYREATQCLIAARSIKVYKKPGSTTDTNYQQTIKKNKKVKFTGIWTNGKQCWMRVTVNGMKGYIKCYKYNAPQSTITYFKDAWFAA